MSAPGRLAGPLALLRQALRFLVGTCLGLSVDLSVFGLLTWAGLAPWLANVLSSACAVTVVYLVSTRYAFGAAMSVRSYVLFVGWYALTITVFSLLIQLVVQSTGWAPLVAKLLSLPPSFLANFLFSRWLFHREPAPLEVAP
ncbi:GtrA family protein [Pseudokineococcus marinus]|uniref:GtrA family protein n=1 Tax=Pseudokineococcus marinus TaxID=351215 RepID=A0A849BP36_9ACTN|nr:GtrA family protein [Pseudokineococcus marinus]NNH22807.1 GtrA family protein [Pseudokineococcus marinus]